MYYERSKYVHEEAAGVGKIAEWAKTLLYTLFPQQRRGHEQARAMGRKAAEDDRQFNHMLFRKIKDMDPETRQRLQSTQLGARIEQMAKREEERRSANH